MLPGKLLRELFLEGVAFTSPEKAIGNVVDLREERLAVEGQLFDLREHSVYVLAVGKAAVPMYTALDEVLGRHLRHSLVITPDNEEARSCSADEVIFASHPVPDQQSLQAGQEAVEFLQQVPEDALVLTLLSGGTSSLMCYPSEGISIKELSLVFELLNNSGATISEINTVRKHCSQIKGGQLLRYLDPRVPMIDLVISDVPDDDLSVIGSGPTTPDRSTYQDAYHILLKYELWDRLPASVQEHVEKGINGERMETLKPDKDPLEEHHSYIISSARMLAERVSELASKKGIASRIAQTPFNEDVKAVSSKIAEEVLRNGKSREDNPTLFIYYGESTVQVSGDGKGGRNQELALRGAVEIAARDDITLLSAGTDGIDGPTDAAGAVVDGSTITAAREQGLDPEEYLSNNDSYHFHEQMGTLLKTGPTGNNLMDLVLVLVE